jgi:hypothetical protein
VPDLSSCSVRLLIFSLSYNILVVSSLIICIVIIFSCHSLFKTLEKYQRYIYASADAAVPSSDEMQV